MRLLITTDTVGGVWTYTRELSEGLLERGHDVLLISMGRMPSLDQQGWVDRVTARWAKKFSYVATDHPLEWMQNNARCYSDAEPVLLTHVRTWNPDILHLNQFCYGALPTDVPKIVMAHSDVMSWSHACRGELPSDSKWFRHYVRVVSEGLAQANAAVAPTRWMLAALCNYFHAPQHRAVIANGRAVPAPDPSRPKKMQAVTIGRVWDEGKNVRVLEDVVSPMPLLVAGELSLETEPPFHSSRMQLLGHLSEAATLRLFAESSVYIATSRYEPFGLAPLEAALSGCAIIANDIASLREVWGESAFYFKSANHLTDLLHGLHADARLLARAASKARLRARSLFSRDTMLTRYLSLYTRLASRTIAAIENEAPAQHVS